MEYWNTLANQLILISSLLSGFSITIVANLIVSEKNDKLTNGILKTAAISAVCFLVTLFAMTKIFMITTPGGYLKSAIESDLLIPRLIGMFTFIIGLLALSTLISLSGWTKSRKLGRFTTFLGALSLFLILLTLIEISF